MLSLFRSASVRVTCHVIANRSPCVWGGQVAARLQRNGWSVPSRSGSSHAARSLPTSRASTLSPRHGVCRTRPSLSRPTAHRRISRTCSWSLTRPSAVGLLAGMPTRRPAMTRRCPVAMRWWGTRRQVSTTACGRRLALAHRMRCVCRGRRRSVLRQRGEAAQAAVAGRARAERVWRLPLQPELRR